MRMNQNNLGYKKSYIDDLVSLRRTESVPLDKFIDSKVSFA